MLALVLFVPFLGAVLIALLGRWPVYRDGVSVITAVCLFGLVLRLVPHTDPDTVDPETMARLKDALALVERRLGARERD